MKFGITQKLINEDGKCEGAELTLARYVSCNATRDKRIDHQVFSFHKLYSSTQGEALAKHFLQPYIESGKIKPPSNYAEIAAIVSDYTPAQIETAFAEVANKADIEIDVNDMIKNLQSKVGRKKLRENIKEAEQVKSFTITLVEGEQAKRLDTTLDFAELGLNAVGLTAKQIMFALRNYTPETLTQENIIAAFGQVRKSGS